VSRKYKNEYEKLGEERRLSHQHYSLNFNIKPSLS
jgi:hypothetical protein